MSERRSITLTLPEVGIGPLTPAERARLEANRKPAPRLPSTDLCPPLVGPDCVPDHGGR